MALRLPVQKRASTKFSSWPRFTPTNISTSPTAPGALTTASQSNDATTLLCLRTMRWFEQSKQSSEQGRQQSPLGIIRFDLTKAFFVRALYQTLHPAYLTNTGGNSRTAAMAASVFAPNAVVIRLRHKRTNIQARSRGRSQARWDSGPISGGDLSKQSPERLDNYLR